MVKKTVVQKGEGKQVVVQYYTSSSGNSPGRWKDLKSTGRWQIEKIFDENGKIIDAVMYVEHKGLIFKQWIHENDIRIVEQYVPEIVIIECEEVRK